MKIISADRGQGKTTKLVEISSKEWKHIVCKDRQGVDVIIKTAERLGLDIPYPITIRELLKGGLSMSNNFHVNPKEEKLNQMREELRERAKRELFWVEFDEIKRKEDEK